MGNCNNHLGNSETTEKVDKHANPPTDKDDLVAVHSVLVKKEACTRHVKDLPMSASAMQLLLTRPRVMAPLDPNFAPLTLGKRSYLAAVDQAGHDALEWSLPRSGGCCAHGALPVFRETHPDHDASLHLAGVLIQEMLWSRGASGLVLVGPPKLCEALKQAYSPEGKYAFEVSVIPKLCGTPNKPFVVTIVSEARELPPEKDDPLALGRDAGGSRLAFELGRGGVLKTVALRDGEVLEAKETEWDSENSDPAYHWDTILRALKGAAEKLENKVEAIGGCAQGIISSASEATWSSIFPNVPAELYQEHIVPMFEKLAKEFGDVKFRMVNEGELAALAGMKMVKAGNLLALSMGCGSRRVGYCCADGKILGWLNELGSTLLDLNPEAPRDPWPGGHRGIIHMYLGERALMRLMPKAGLTAPEEHEPHSKCMELLQAALKDPNTELQAKQVYETLGVYLGYALAQFVESYKVDHVVLLGHTVSGDGVRVACDKAREVLTAEFPELGRIQFHLTDQNFETVTRSLAVAALPSLAPLGKDPVMLVSL